MTGDDISIERRLHIGAISPTLAQDISDLENRIEKHGKIIKSIELRKKDTLDTFYGFITVKMTQKEYSQLRSALNGVNFKGSKLIIDIAKSDFQEEWKRDHDRKDQTTQVLKRKELIKQRNESKKVLKLNLLEGRIRKSKRDFKNVTYRALIKGKLKTIKCWKQKLWGYQKEKTMKDLVWRYANGIWTDGTEHVIERTNFIKTKRPDNLTIESNHNTVRAPAFQENEEAEAVEAERLKNQKILDGLMEQFDFDQKLETPIPGEKLEDQDADSDFEIQYHSDSELYNANNTKPLSNCPVNERESVISKSANYSKKAVHFGEEENSEDEDEDNEFMPSFEGSNFKIDEPKINDTTILRGIFGTSDKASEFTLVDDNNSDIDLDNVIEEHIVSRETPEAVSNEPMLTTTVQRGLYFPHFESPFLSAQSQISRFKQFSISSEDWKTEFEEKSEEWEANTKRRRRDVLRQIEKSKGKSQAIL